MMHRIFNVLLFLAFVATLGLNWLVRSRPSEPNREFIPEMVRTARYNAYSANQNFPDGKTLQLPEPGTIPRGRLPLHYGPSFEDFLRAGDELHNPLGLPAASASIAGLLSAPLRQGPTLAAAVLMPGRSSSFAVDVRARERGAFIFTN